MTGPARAGVLIYAKNLERLSEFYQQLLTMQCLFADAEHHVLESADMQMVIHAIPAHIACAIQIETPPAVREEQAIKPFFTVKSIAGATLLASSLGGCVLEHRWPGPGFTLCNGCDPEGNVFQLREWQS